MPPAVLFRAPTAPHPAGTPWAAEVPPRGRGAPWLRRAFSPGSQTPAPNDHARRSTEQPRAEILAAGRRNRGVRDCGARSGLMLWLPVHFVGNGALVGNHHDMSG